MILRVLILKLRTDLNAGTDTQHYLKPGVSAKAYPDTGHILLPGAEQGKWLN